jgi:hypothetical protein
VAATPLASRVAAVTPAPGADGVRVLLVDDDPLVRLGLRVVY